MKSLFLYFVLLICITGCSESHSIIVNNNSGKEIDSITVYINSFKLNFTKLNSEKSLELYFPIDSVNVEHSVTLLPYIYINAKTIAGQYYYNDLGGMNKKYDHNIIDSTMKVKWSIAN